MTSNGNIVRLFLTILWFLIAISSLANGLSINKRRCVDEKCASKFLLNLHALKIYGIEVT